MDANTPIPDGHFSGGAHLTESGEDDLAGIINAVKVALAATGGPQVQTEVAMTTDTTPTAQQSGTLFRADPEGGEITLTLDPLPQGTWFELLKVDAGVVMLATGAGATARQTDLQVANTYERMRVQMGPGNEWNVEGTLSAAPAAVPAGGVQYLRLEDITTEGSLVTSMNDVLAAADLVQADALRPSLGSGNGPGGSDSIVFSGTQYFPRAVLAAPITQPCFVSTVIYIPSGSNTGSLWDDDPASNFQRCNLNFQNIRGFSGGGGSWGNTSHAFDTWFVMSVHYDGASTAIKIGGGAWGVVTDPGSNGIKGLSMGASSDNSAIASFRTTDRVCGVGSRTVAEGWHSFLQTLRGL